MPLFNSKVLLLHAVMFALAITSTANAQRSHPAEEFIDRAAQAVRTDPEASRRDAEAALEVLIRAPNADLELRAHLLLCDYFSERDRPAAEQQIVRANALLPKVQRVGLRSGVLDCQGTILETAGDNAAARDLYEKAVEVAIATDDQEMLANALYSRGYLLGVQGRYAAGLMDLKRAKNIYADIDLPQHSLTALNSVAILYNRMGEYAEARDMFMSALKEQRKAGLRREQGVTLHNLGRAHENLREWPAAQKAFGEAAEISRSLQYARGEAYALRGLAAVANAQGEPQLALQLLEQAEQLQHGTPDARLHAQIQLARGIALHKLRKFSASAQSLESALKVFKAADSMHELRETYSVMAAVYADLNNWQPAYKSLSESKRTSERLLQNQIDQRFATLKVEFDTAAKEQQNVLLSRENEANQKALAYERRARSLQRAVMGLTALLAVLLAVLAIHQWRMTRRMRRLAMTDELTGLANRRAMLGRLEPMLRQGSPCAALIIDIDHFKSINDQYGHPQGDEALRRVASCLRAELGEIASIGRLGGEEFIVIVPDADTTRARTLAEHLRQCVMNLDMRPWLTDRSITVSTGATVSVVGDSVSNVLQRADTALYEAKRSGRNCVFVKLKHTTEEVQGSPSVMAETQFGLIAKKHSMHR